MRSDKQIRESIDEKRQTYIDVAEFIWEHPEPIFKEYRSSERLREMIRAEGFQIQEQAAGLETAFIAEWVHQLLALWANLMLCLESAKKRTR